MKAIHRFFLIALLFVPLGLTAQIAGKWKMSVPDENGNMATLKVKISDDGTYALDFGGDGTVEVTGKYTDNGGKLTIQDNGSDCTGKGVYSYKIEGNTMTMTRVSDECPDRGGPEGVMTLQRD